MKIFTQQVRTLLLSAVVVVIGAVGVSYGDNPVELVGQWVAVEVGENKVDVNVELFKDGTGVVGTEDLKWKTEGKRFVLSYDGETVVGDYNLSGSEFTRTFEGGNAQVWVRKDKVEEYKKKRAELAIEEMKKETEKRFAKNVGSFTDSRDAQKYRTATIGGMTWMAQNLNYPIGKSWCYGNDNSNCDKYGRLYDWNTAKTACPSGYYLPTLKDWSDLIKRTGGGFVGVRMYGGSVESGDASGWALKAENDRWKNGGGVDGYGFTALPGGSRNTDGSFEGIDGVGIWWMNKEWGKSTAITIAMTKNAMGVETKGNNIDNGFSVRCVKDGEMAQLAEQQTKEAAQKQQKELQRIEKISGYFTDPRDGQKYRAVRMTWRDSQGQVNVDTWMAQNLNYQPQNGNSWCYGDDASNCTKCGRLYDMKTAKDVCPKGWKLGYWNPVAKTIGSKAGEALKSQWGWYNEGNGKDTYGFSALPCGGRSSDGKFTGIGEQGLWWDSGWGTGPVALNYDNDSMKIAKKDPNLGASVRCVQK